MPDPVDAPLRVGMSATAIITTAEVDDAIVVPNRFIQLDRESGKASVYKLVDGEPVRQEVELGLRNERASQIVAGVDAGDEHRPGHPERRRTAAARLVRRRN